MNPRRAKGSVAVPIMVLIGATTSFQLGAAAAKGLFPEVGASGAATLRLVLAAAMLLPVWRPWRLRPTRREWCALIGYGAALGVMNFLFYSSLRTIPLGIVIALEFTGPLTVAIAASHSAVDFLWTGFAALGIAMLLGLGVPAQPRDPGGVLCGLGAGVCWALYIVFGRRVGAAHGGASTALGLLVGAVIIAPIGLASAGAKLFAPSLLPTALAVALMSGALPYPLEMYALPRLPARTYGVLMSLGPALGALSGRLFLGEHLSAIQWLAIGCIMLASGGSALAARQPNSITAA